MMHVIQGWNKHREENKSTIAYKYCKLIVEEYLKLRSVNAAPEVNLKVERRRRYVAALLFVVGVTQNPRPWLISPGRFVFTTSTRGDASV